MIKKILLPIFIAIISINVVSARAEIRCQLAEGTKKGFAETSTGPNIETTSTASSTFGFLGTVTRLISNDTYETMNKCAAADLADFAARTGRDAPELGEGCEVEDPTRCEGMGLLDAGKNQQGFRPGGSLMGLATAMERAVQDPLPVNLAYYINQNARKIPGLKNTAFAQDTIEYGGPFLGAIYHYWTISRNIAYAFLAAAMTVIGIMIIMGKSIDPKAGVTVQQALPQIIIALILITFSYPIGAAGASLAYNIRGSLDSSGLLEAANQLDISTVSMIGFFASIGGIANGVVALVMSIIAVVMSLIMGILVFFKIFGIYLKMLFAIITAPVSFAIGAIPGNQDTTMNWFKQFGAYMVSLPAMSFAAWFIFGLIGDIGWKAMTSFEEFGNWGFGLLAGLAIPAITYLGFTITLTIPDKIEGMFGIKGGK